MPESVTITDNRTGESVEIPIINGGVDAGAWKKLLGNIWFADPGFTQTAATESAITELDGENGILRYRGYPIEQLAENSTYLEVAYLLIYGELPTSEQYAEWVHEITYHTYIHENVRKRFMEGFHHDAHPMGMLVSAVAALSTFYPEAKQIHDEDVRDKQIVRLIAKMPTLAAGAHRFSVGMPFVYPDNRLDFASNFLSMMWRIGEPDYQADPVLARALDILFILHADHEQNCGTTAMRVAGSSHSDPYSAAAAATAALYGPRHGGANEAVIKMLNEIGHVDNVPAYVASVKEGKGRLQGFGHRVPHLFALGLGQTEQIQVDGDIREGRDGEQICCVVYLHPEVDQLAEPRSLGPLLPDDQGEGRHDVLGDVDHFHLSIPNRSEYPRCFSPPRRVSRGGSSVIRTVAAGLFVQIG